MTTKIRISRIFLQSAQCFFSNERDSSFQDFQTPKLSKEWPFTQYFSYCKYELYTTLTCFFNQYFFIKWPKMIFLQYMLSKRCEIIICFISTYFCFLYLLLWCRVGVCPWSRVERRPKIQLSIWKKYKNSSIFANVM